MTWPPITHQDVQDAVAALRDPTAERTFTDGTAPTTAFHDALGIDFDSGEPIPNAVIRYTAVTPGSYGSTIAVQHVLNSTPDGSAAPLAVTVVPASLSSESTITVLLPNAGSNTLVPVSLANIAAVVNTDGEASALVTASFPSGADSSLEVISVDNAVARFLTGGADPAQVRIKDGVVASPLRVAPTEIGLPALTLRPAPTVTGVAALNVEHRDGTPNSPLGYGVTHLDNDGGGGLASDRITWSEYGNMIINVPSGTPLDLRRAGRGALQFMGGLASLSVYGQDQTSPPLLVGPIDNETTQPLVQVVTYDADYNQSDAFTVNMAGRAYAAAGYATGNSEPASTLGTVVGRTEVFDKDGVSLGFIPIYDTIT